MEIDMAVAAKFNANDLSNAEIKAILLNEISVDMLADFDAAMCRAFRLGGLWGLTVAREINAKVQPGAKHD